MKNKWVALILCFLTGLVGGHHYYLGNWKKGIIRFYLTLAFVLSFILLAIGDSNLIYISFVFFIIDVIIGGVDFFRILLDANYISNYKTVSFKEDMKESIQAENRNKELKKKAKEEKKKNNVVCCPKCGSPSITAQKRGFSVGKAIAGTALSLGHLDVGALAGATGKNKIEITCLNCGYKWKPGKK